jgi:hypothetical protein
MQSLSSAAAYTLAAAAYAPSAAAYTLAAAAYTPSAAAYTPSAAAYMQHCENKATCSRIKSEQLISQWYD